MALSQKFFKANINRIFIAYSYPYIEYALEALKKAPNAEVIIVQPYEKRNAFVSTKEAVDLYKVLKPGQDIPILFTPQGRMSQDGQFFEYGARLLDVLDVNNEREEVEQKIKSGKWILQSGDNFYSLKNVLVIKAPIIPLPEKFPIGMAMNILRRNPGKPIQAIAIPAPKLIGAEYEAVLRTL